MTIVYGRCSSSCAVRLISSSVTVASLTCLREGLAHVGSKDVRPAIGNHDTPRSAAEAELAPAQPLEVVATQLQLAAQLVGTHGVRPLSQPPAQLPAVHASPAYRIEEQAEPA